MQGDGELCGVALEVPATVEAQIDPIKAMPIAWQRFETDAFRMVIVSARPLEEAARIACGELVRRVAADTGMDGLEAWVKASAEAPGGIDIVVADVPALAVADDEGARTRGFATAMMHTVRLVNAAMPWLGRFEAGTICAVSRVPGRETDFTVPACGAFKAALVHSMHGLAVKRAPQGIRANTVSPGHTSSTAASGRASRRATRPCSRRRWPSTPPAAWPGPRRSPAAWRSCRARPRRSPWAWISSSTAR